MRTAIALLFGLMLAASQAPATEITILFGDKDCMGVYTWPDCVGSYITSTGPGRIVNEPDDPDPTDIRRGSGHIVTPSGFSVDLGPLPAQILSGSIAVGGVARPYGALFYVDGVLVSSIEAGGVNNLYFLTELPISPALFDSIEELEQVNFSIRSSHAHLGGETAVYLDFVEITLQMVPEPSTALLLALGLMALAAGRRRL